MEPVVAVAEQVGQMGAMAIPVSSFYIGINLLLTLLLAVLVVRARVQTKTDMGDGGNELMKKAIRAHGNNIEYVPMALLGIVTIDLMGVAPLWVHVLGVALTTGRTVHAMGIYESLGATGGRFIGTILTWAVMLIAGLVTLTQAVL